LFFCLIELTIRLIWGTIYYMKIIIATPLYPPETGPLSNYSKDLALTLAKENDLNVLAYANNIEKNNNFEIYTISKKQSLLIRIIKFVFKLLSIARASDFILAQNAVAAGLPAVVVQKITGTKAIINFYEDEAWKRVLGQNISKQSYEDFLASPQADNRIKKIIKIQSWVLRNAYKIIVATQAEADNINKYYKVNKDKIFINPRIILPTEKLSFDEKVVDGQIFFSGRLYDWAGVEKLIDKVEESSEASLLIAGEGPHRSELEKIVNKKILGDRIKFLGRISKAENYYHKQTSNTVVSDIEEFSIPWSEHMINLNKILK
jgi:glycosyltransferase involved in cell wall biosynthesis